MSEVQTGLEVNQRADDRLALGAHGKTIIEAEQEDVGWASFEAWKPLSKILCGECLRKLGHNRWATKVLKYLSCGR